MIILGIETSGLLCSVTWYKDNQIMLEYNIEKPQIHTNLLADFVAKGMKELEISAGNIGLAAISTGPGSYTGLRIGMSYCKGFCYGQSIPIIGVSNFRIMTEQAPVDKNHIYTLINANRGKFYYAYYSKQNKKKFEQGIVSEPEIDKFDLSNSGAIFDYYSEIDPEKEIWKRFQWLHKVRFNASILCKAAEKKYIEKGADKIEEIEPLYLQAFAGTL